MKFSSRFIKRNNKMCDFDTWVSAPYFRKTFDLDFAAETAEITITGLGFYELYINGKNITKGPLAPYISNFHHVVYYDNYDIAKYLKKGKNAIGIILGNGMRNAFGGFIWDFEKISARGPVCTALCTEIKGEGKEFVFEADESFKTHSSPILFDDLRMGCVYDSNLEIEGWNMPDFDDSKWDNAIFETTPAGKPALCRAEPIAVTEKLKPVSIKHFDKLPFAYNGTEENASPFESTYRENVYLYDFGVNNAGISVLKINGKPGQKITVRHLEYGLFEKYSISNISFIRPESTEKYFEYAQKDVFICKGGEEVFVPKFKYDGFRYLFVEGLEENQATEDAFEFYVMSSNLKTRSNFSSSSEIINKLYEMTKRSDISNFYYFPTDCPQREKNGWTGDASMSAEHMMLSFNAEESLREWLKNIRHAQKNNGKIPAVIPTYDWGFEWGPGPSWDSVIFNLPYEIYRHTGDKGVIEENAQMMIRYLSYILSMRKADGTIAFGLGDWMDPYETVHKKITSPLAVTDTIMTYLNAKKAAFMFDIIGKKYEKQFALNVADEMKQVVRTNLINFETMTVSGDCQTSQAFAVAAGVFEDDEIEKAYEKLLEIIDRDNNENACGMIGLRYIFHLLCKMGNYDLAYKMITSEKRTGYGFWVKQGLTTLPENFFYGNGRDVYSLNHHIFGDMLSCFIQDFAGLKPNPTYTDPMSFEISPCFVTDLNFAKASYETARGTLYTEWKRNGEKVIVTVDVPAKMHGCLVLKDYLFNGLDRVELTEGKYMFETVKNKI